MKLTSTHVDYSDIHLVVGGRPYDHRGLMEADSAGYETSDSALEGHEYGWYASATTFSGNTSMSIL
ncbi:predicted protein [Plenodomus lingam JN3]|uniref:Predicted protein n=1 Tax=Leptosphaeria maculans (strain JN3 / isolate v23.1.3 / race Av1-4-5-6-7-8) TaxID=985895 RepID=E4ZIW9_LEPMJ|nr:predicted protein [Plenodomus lingam JN3]CBX91239.1 predicted protein [Plenodomus lingam JN3]